MRLNCMSCLSIKLRSWGLADGLARDFFLAASDHNSVVYQAALVLLLAAARIELIPDEPGSVFRKASVSAGRERHISYQPRPD